MITAVELRLYNEAATNFVLLPHFVTASLDVKYNDMGALQLSYPLDDDPAGAEGPITGARTLHLTDQSLIGALLMFDDGTQEEMERYLIDSTSDDQVLDGRRIRQLTGRATLALLDDPVVYPSNWPVTAPSGHQFVDSTAGTIFRTLILRAKTRGCFPHLNETSFTGLADSAGEPWALKLGDQKYENGVTYLQIAQDLMNRGLIDVRLDGWNLVIQNGGDFGSHVPIGTVEVRPSKNVSSMTKTTDSTESASTVLISGEEGTAIERHNPGAQSILGRRRERSVSQGGVSDAGTLTILADAELQRYGRVTQAEEVGIVASGLTPWKDFRPSDWIYVRFEGTDEPVERRVRQLAVGVDANRQLTLGMTLNDIIYENDVKLQRKIDGYSGASSTYGPTPNQTDNTTPNSPEGLAVSSTTFISTQGIYVAAVSASWAVVTSNVGGSPVTDLAGYELTWRYAGDASWSFVHFSDDTNHQWSPVAPGRQIEVRVRSVDDSGNRSGWSPSEIHTVATDETPPPKPSGPIVAPRFAAVVVRWDGLGIEASGPVPMPLDLDRVEIWQSPLGGFTPQDPSSSLAGSIGYGGGEFMISGPFDVAINVKLVAVDKAGNRSAASTQGSAVPSRVGTPDVDPGTKISDGLPPDSSPTPEAIGGLGIFSVRWTPPTNHDPLFYDVHISPNDDFTPTPSTRVDTTSSTMATIRALPGPEPDPGATDLRNLQYDTTYFFKIVAFDIDGHAAPGAADSAVMLQVNSPDIRARSIVTEHMQAQSITAELLAGELVLASVIKTAPNGQRVEVDVSGLKLYGPANEIMVNLPTTPGVRPSISGDAQLDAATILNGLSMRSTNNRVETSSGVTLASGVAPPINPPQLNVTYETYRPDATISRPSSMGTFALNPNEVTGTTLKDGVLSIYQLKTNGTRVWHYDTTGTPIAPFMTNYPWWDVRGTVEMLGFSWTLYKDLRVAADTWYIQRTNVATTVTNKYTRINPGAAPRIGTTGTQLFIAECHPSNNQLNIRFIQFSGADLANATVTSTLLSSTTRPIGGSCDAVLYGNFDYGAPRYIVSLHQTNANFRTLLPTGQWGTNEDWESPTASRRGLIWDGTQFWTYGADGLMYKHTTYKWTSESSTWWAGYTWYDARTAGGTHETDLGALASLTMRKRAKLTISLPVVPDQGTDNSPNQWRLYMTRSATQPSPLATFFQVAGSTTAVDVITPNFSGTAPPSLNNFTDAVAGWLRSEKANLALVPQFEVDGFAIGRWGALSFAANGHVQTTTFRLSQQGHDDWTDFTLLNSWVNYDSNYPDPGFILGPDGFVTLRGMVKNGSSGTAAIATLPSTDPKVRPPYLWSVSSLSSAGGILIAITTAGAITASGSTSTTWTDLNGVRIPTF